MIRVIAEKEDFEMKKLITTTAVLIALGGIATAQPEQAQANPIAVCITEASRVYPVLTMDALRNYMAEHPTCASAPVGKWVEQPMPAQSANCPVEVFGFKGCKDLERLQEDIESIRPCAEMSKRGMQAEADRCHKETRKFQRDIRDRARP
jgi:hypothetical protein